MTHLNASQLSTIRGLLEAEREELMASVRALSADDAHLAEAQTSGESRPRNEGDGDSVAVERHLVAQLSASAASALSEIDAALTRVNDGTYGSCADCGQGIHPDRLEARPRATACVRCASARR